MEMCKFVYFRSQVTVVLGTAHPEHIQTKIPNSKLPKLCYNNLVNLTMNIDGEIVSTGLSISSFLCFVFIATSNYSPISSSFIIRPMLHNFHLQLLSLQVYFYAWKIFQGSKILLLKFCLQAAISLESNGEMIWDKLQKTKSLCWDLEKRALSELCLSPVLFQHLAHNRHLINPYEVSI